MCGNVGFRRVSVHIRTMENWDDYRFFLAVIRKGSVTGAAEALNINHTTVSRRISALEARLGLRLFDRTRSGYTPTPEASQFVAPAEQLEANAHSIARLSRSHDRRLSGELTVTAPPVLVRYVLMPIVQRFHERFRGIALRFHASERVSNLVNREADVAIRASAAPMETLMGARMAVNRNALSATRAYLDGRGVSALTALDRDDLDWVSIETSEGETAWRLRYFPNGQEACRADSKMTGIAAALAGLGVVELPQLVGDAEPALVRLEGASLKSDRDIWILYHRDLRHTARLRAFVSHVRAEFPRTG